MFDYVTDLQQQNRSKYCNISKTQAGEVPSPPPPPPVPTTTIVPRWGYDLACTPEG